MSSHETYDDNAVKHSTTHAYNARNPIPTIHGYQQAKEERQADSVATAPAKVEAEKPAVEEKTGSQILNKAKDYLHIDGQSKDGEGVEHQPYQSENRNLDSLGNLQPTHHDEDSSSVLEDTSEAIGSTLDPKQKRKNMKKSRHHAPRNVTDPVTHLPVMIHDFTEKELSNAPQNDPPPGLGPHTTTESSEIGKSPPQVESETHAEQAKHQSIEKLFPPPDYDAIRENITLVYSRALMVSCGLVLIISLSVLMASSSLGGGRKEVRPWKTSIFTIFLIITFAFTLGCGALWVLQDWLKHRIDSIWNDEVWAASRRQEDDMSDSEMPESTQWLNSILSSVWSLVNPDLFASLADTLEDVMQASLPKMVRMISVEDLGQGSEALRILGVRWLPTGAASKSVSEDGKIKGSKGSNDRAVPGEGEIDDNDQDGQTSGDHESQQENEDSGKDKNIAEGMEAEEGDFVNVEVGFSYRASSNGKSLAVKSKNAHLYLAFYLPGRIKFPVWVELRGIVGTLRMRLQLCPDPPFFALCTMTLLGQPRIDISCMPLTKKLNVMDLPFVSSFIGSSIDAALSSLVAPKSLTLDLKDMLVGDDFKKDTSHRGVLIVRIKQGRDFKAGDPGLGPLKKGSSDAYVAVGWAKFGKPVWSTRVIVDELQPVWEETAFILVGPEEINAEERLRLQLWDSDRTSADDDLGRLELDLKDLMHSSEYRATMKDRSDGFQALEGSQAMPGTLDWAIGYFPKTRIQDEQLSKQKIEPVDKFEELKEKVSNDVERKLREAVDRDASTEKDQQKAQDLKTREDAMIISTPPLVEYPTGILSIQIHNITGLEYEKINKNRTNEGDESEIEAGDESLPSAYCTIMMNHQKVFKTRTKPKNGKPFFNAGTERMIRDWRTTEIMVSVRDARVHEEDPLLGVLHFPISKILQNRSQIMDSFPLVGGIAYGRLRISMVFRSIETKLPKEMLGWDYGTLEISSAVHSKDISSELRSLRLKLRTSVNRGKMHSSNSEGISYWKGKHKRSIRLAVRKRYCSCLVAEFRKNKLGLDKTPAFAVLWLKDLADEEESTVTLTVWRNDGENMERAQSNCVTENLGERMGHIEIPIKFHRGLGPYHQRLAGKSPDLQDIFEVLSTANDNSEAGSSNESDNSDASSDSSQEDNGKENHPKTNGVLKKIGLAPNGGDSELDKNGNGGPVEKIKDYQVHSEQLHRRHRGLMQFKGARTAKWMKTKVEHGKNHMLDTFQHHERSPGIETEV